MTTGRCPEYVERELGRYLDWPSSIGAVSLAIINGVLSLEHVGGTRHGVTAGSLDWVTVVAWEIDTMNTSGNTAAVAFAAIVLGAMTPAALGQGTSDKEVFINSKDIKWGDAPPSIPKGAKLAVLQGDPGKPGPFVIRLMLPPGLKIPPHAHSQDESLTVISGTFYFGTGDKIEMSKAHALNAGGFHALSAGDHHYAFAKAQTVVQVNGMGPFNMTYINPDDDPQKAKK